MKPILCANENRIELEQLICELYSSYKVRARRKQIELNLFYDLAGCLKLQDNNRRLRQLLHTVINNSIEHSRATKIRFSVRPLLRTCTDILLEFELEENGIQRRRSKNFAFFRSVITAKQMVDEIQGKSELIAVPDTATTFKFIVKCSYHSEVYNKEQLNLSPLSGCKILVAEDNEVNQQSIRRILEQEGITFVLAANGREAIERFEQERTFDLVLMDLQMPQMDGFQAVNFLRKQLTISVPVIALSAIALQSKKLSPAELGFNGIINKPFTRDQLLKALKKQILTNTLKIAPKPAVTKDKINGFTAVQTAYGVQTPHTLRLT